MENMRPTLPAPVKCVPSLSEDKNFVVVDPKRNVWRVKTESEISGSLSTFKDVKNGRTFLIVNRHSQNRMESHQKTGVSTTLANSAGWYPQPTCLNPAQSTETGPKPLTSSDMTSANNLCKVAYGSSLNSDKVKKLRPILPLISGMKTQQLNCDKNPLQCDIHPATSSNSARVSSPKNADVTPSHSNANLGTNPVSFPNNALVQRPIKPLISGMKTQQLNCDENPLQCDICEKILKTKGGLLRHKIVHSQTFYKCKDCGKSFKHKQNYHTHVRVHDERCVKRCTYPSCDFKCGSYAILLRHMVKHDSEVHECEVCGKYFKNKRFFQHHMRLHTSNDIYVCEVCGMRFPVPSFLAKHMESHSGKLNYKCQWCDRRYKQKRGLRRHEIEIHGEHPKSKARYECKYCGRIWATPSTLRKHLIAHKRERLSKRCTLCGMTFQKISEFDAHYRKHINKTVYGCNLCQKVFATSSLLESHKKIHNGIKEKYVCIFCDKVFERKDTLFGHIKKIHRHLRKADDCEECFVIWPWTVNPAICKLLHGKGSKDLKIVVPKLTAKDLAKYDIDLEDTWNYLKRQQLKQQAIGEEQAPPIEVGIIMAPTNLNDSNFQFDAQNCTEYILEADTCLSSVGDGPNFFVVDQHPAELKNDSENDSDEPTTADPDLMCVSNDLTKDESNTNDLELSANAEQQNVINIVPMDESDNETFEEDFIICKNIDNSDDEDEAESTIVTRGESSKVESCLLVNKKDVPIDEKIALEFPFINIAREHNYVKTDSLHYVGYNTCIHGNQLSKLDSLFVP